MADEKPNPYQLSGTLNSAWDAEMKRVAAARGKSGAEYNGAGRYGPNEGMPGYGGGTDSMDRGDAPLTAAMKLAEMGDPRTLMALLFNKANASYGGHNGIATIRPQMGLAGIAHAAAGNNMNIRGGLEGQNRSRQSVQSMQRPGGGMMGPAPARAGARTQGQQDYDAERERRRRMADMDAEMAQKVKWMNAMGLGGPAGQVSETEVTGQLYNNAGAHKVMPITTKRTRDITPQERAQFYQMIMGGR